MRPAHFSRTIFSLTTLTRVSFLHLGQNSGNFTRTVSAFTLVRVLLPQTGQCTHRDELSCLLIENTPSHMVPAPLRQASGFARFPISYFNRSVFLQPVRRYGTTIKIISQLRHFSVELALRLMRLARRSLQFYLFLGTICAG